MKVHNLICLHDIQMYYLYSYRRVKVKKKMLVIKISLHKSTLPAASHQLILFHRIK